MCPVPAPIFLKGLMKRRVSKSEMRLYMKELRAKASSFGCKVKIRYRPIIWNRYGGLGPNFGEMRGVYAGNLKEIQVVVYGRPSRIKLLYYLAHEVRHAEHDFLGLFKDYYRKDIYKLVSFVWGKKKTYPKNVKKPCNKTAFLAEKDCDRSAEKFLLSKNIESLAKKKNYRFDETFAYHLNSRLKEKGF
jgi:hypothetical protein